MKKHAIIIGLVAVALAFGSCGLLMPEEGGTIEVTNDSDYSASITIYSETKIVVSLKNIESRETLSFDVSEDGSYTVSALYGTSHSPYTVKGIAVSGGETKKVSIK